MLFCIRQTKDILFNNTITILKWIILSVKCFWALNKEQNTGANIRFPKNTFT